MMKNFIYLFNVLFLNLFCVIYAEDPMHSFNSSLDDSQNTPYGFDQVIQTTNADLSGLTTLTEFDALKNSIKIIKKDPFGHSISHQEMTWDLNHRKVKETYFLNEEESVSIIWLYDSFDNLIEIQEAVDTSNPKCTHYAYDENGQLMTLLKPDGVSIHYEYFPHGNISRLYSSDQTIDYAFSYDMNQNISSILDNIGHHLTDLKGNLKEEMHEIVEETSNSAFVKDLRSKTKTMRESIFNTFHNIHNFINSHLSFEHQFKSKIEDAALAIFSKASLNLYGFYLDEQEVGIFGQREIHPKVRITLINGILNARHDLIDTLEMISKFHGDNNIHYVFRPTEGWTYDLIKSTLVKMGWASPQSQQLATKWKELIEEMGGVQEGGKIIHYAHSIGAVDTFIAKSLLTPEELKMIKVYTFGSPHLFGPSGFQSVTNYISKGDGVSLLDPVGYIESLLHPSDHIAFIPSSWPIPIIDHPLTFPAYQSTLEMLGKQFLEMYGSPP